MQNFLGTSNQFLVELNGEKIRDCMLARKRHGRWPHPAPIGYLNRKTEDGSKKWIEPDPERAPLLAAAFEAVARGDGITATLEIATGRGLRSRGAICSRTRSTPAAFAR
jgi:DNA invertase Pin-like site-specific DNA recombinase